MSRTLILLTLALTAPLLAADLAWTPAAAPERVWQDWLRQDCPGDPAGCFTDATGSVREQALVKRVADELAPAAQAALTPRAQALVAANVPGSDDRWRALYRAACEQRRAQRLLALQARYPRVVYTRHYNLGGSHYAYTEGQSDAQAERHFVPGTALCLLDVSTGRTADLLADPGGVIRDPEVSYDGRSILFAWKKSDREDDYHLYELEAASGQVRQITSGLGVADYEGIYLPNGDLLFNSTRCVQTVDCWWTEVSNLYTCRRDGQFLRRLSFDQVHTNFPQVLDDGRIVYTRWDYNDRGQLFPQPLFQMNPDGTGQTEFYGNNSWFPTTLIHARGIPGSHQLVAIATGHHSDQSGKLCLVDRHRGTEENAGIQLLAPVRDTPAVHVDAYGQEGDQFEYPYPLSASEFLVTYAPDGDARQKLPLSGRFGIYWLAADGRRELLAWDERQSCNQSVPLAPRPLPFSRPSTVDYRATTGSYYLQDVYAGPGLAGVARGTIKRLRVIGLEFRAAGIGSNGNSGPAGGALISTPIAIGNGAWDVKVVYGDATVHADGSAYFTAPARTPLYFQALDAQGQAVQTMRTWSTLQPGERQSCVGCHEAKGDAPLLGQPHSQATRAGAQALAPFYGPPRGFSFIREVQPLLDRSCVRCHCDRARNAARVPAQFSPERLAKATVLRGAEVPWQYTTTDPGQGWQQADFVARDWPEGVGGFGREGTPGLRLQTQWLTSDIWLRGTFAVKGDLAGHELVAQTYYDEDVEVYLNGVLALQTQGYVTAVVALPLRPEAQKALHPGLNTIAVHCRQTVGGQGVEVVLLDAGPRAEAPAGPGQAVAFSLRGDQTPEPASGRAWSDGYLALTNAVRPGGTYLGRCDPLVNWVSAQSVPTLLPPYFAGAARSGLLDMLRAGHNGVQLSREDLEKIACWIDLNVPYCGDYTEANCWSEEQRARYRHFVDKRTRLEDEERRGIMALLEAGQ